MPKIDIKKDKRSWKNKKKELKPLFNEVKSEYNSENELYKKTQELNVLAPNLERDKKELTDHVLTLYKQSLVRDIKIISGMQITCLATKIKIVIKEFEQVEIPKNHKVGMSLGTNFKPRL